MTLKKVKKEDIVKKKLKNNKHINKLKKKKKAFFNLSKNIIIGILIIILALLPYDTIYINIIKFTPLSIKSLFEFKKIPPRLNKFNHFYYPNGKNFDDVSGGWNIDPDSDILQNISPNIDIRTVKNDLTIVEFNEKYRNKKPVLIRDITNEWKAHVAWTKDNLIKKYGQRVIKRGMGSDFVYGGGAGNALITVERFIEHISNQSYENPHDFFSFDVDFLNQIPEMKKDFDLPLYFRSFINPYSLKAKQSWMMLSLGASRTGLPFHVHGETWIAMVFGAKRWFVYPPGHNYNKNLMDRFHPLSSVWDWYKLIYPRISNNQKPIEFIQYPGDVVYLPEGWKHQTLNIGDTIGIGGQTAWNAENRLRLALNTLKFSPNDFEAHHDAGVGFGHIGLRDNDPELIEKGYEHLMQAISIKPLNPESYLLACECLDTLDRHEDALSLLNIGKNIFLKGIDVDINLDKVNIKTSLDNDDNIFKTNPKTKVPKKTIATVIHKFGRYLMGAKEYNLAENAFKGVLELDPHYHPALVEQAYISLIREDLETALNLLLEALKYSPNDPDIRSGIRELKSRMDEKGIPTNGIDDILNKVDKLKKKLKD